MHWYIWSMLWLIHIIFPNFSTELWPQIDFRIMFMLNILWNNWWIWSNLVDTLIFCLCQDMRNNKNKHSGGVSCSACNAFFFLFHRTYYCRVMSLFWPFLYLATLKWRGIMLYSLSVHPPVCPFIHQSISALFPISNLSIFDGFSSNFA